MTPTDAIYDDAAQGNPAAREFLFMWNVYCHAVDDLVDSPSRPTSEELLGVLVQAATLYSHPFYRQHVASLLPVVMLVTNAYSDSVSMEGKAGWQGKLADVLRFAGNEMVLAVALLTGGYPRARAVSMKLRSVSQAEHHDQEGKPT